MSNFLDTPLKLDIPKLSSSAKKAQKEPNKVINSNVEIIIVEKPGTLKTTLVKDIKEEELYKKCTFKKPDGFVKQTEWSIKLEGNKFLVEVYAKEDGKANCENKYDFPPPIDTKLFFGACAITCKIKSSDKTFTYTNLSLSLWNKMYDKLFGGFEDLALTCIEDDAEIDELDAIPAEKKTKQGYLKDGFVVDSEDTEDENYVSTDGDEDDDDARDDASTNSNDVESDLEIEDIGSELSEDEYEYSDDDEPTPPKNK